MNKQLSDLGKHVTTLAKQISTTAPSVVEGEQPIFSVVMGTVSLEDVVEGQKIYEKRGDIDNFLSLNVLDSFQALTDKSTSEFTEADIHSSMYLASSIAVHAFHERKSVRTDLGFLESDEVISVLNAVKTLGYKTEMLVISDGGNTKEVWSGLSKQEQWIIYNKDNINRDLVFYMFEDIVGMSLNEAEKIGLDKLVLHRDDGEVL